MKIQNEEIENFKERVTPLYSEQSFLKKTQNYKFWMKILFLIIVLTIVILAGYKGNISALIELILNDVLMAMIVSIITLKMQDSIEDYHSMTDIYVHIIAETTDMDDSELKRVEDFVDMKKADDKKEDSLDKYNESTDSRKNQIHYLFKVIDVSVQKNLQSYYLDRLNEWITTYRKNYFLISFDNSVKKDENFPLDDAYALFSEISEYDDECYIDAEGNRHIHKTESVNYDDGSSRYLYNKKEDKYFTQTLIAEWEDKMNSLCQKAEEYNVRREKTLREIYELIPRK